MSNLILNVISMFSTKMVENNRVMAALLSVLVLSGCTGVALGVGAALLGTNAMPLGETQISSYDFGKGEIIFFQQGCSHKGTWTNNSDKIQRDVRVELKALDENGNVIGVSKLTFPATLPDVTSDSKEQGIVWKTGSVIDFHCPDVARVFAEAYLYN